MKRLRWRPETHADLDEIWAYIARDNVEAADANRKHIIALTDLLRDHPEAGSPVPRLPNVRSRSIGAYRLFYSYRDDVVQILAVRHGARRFIKVVASRLDD